MLTKLIKYFHSKFTINEMYVYQGTQEDIEDVLEQLLLTSKYGFGTNYHLISGSRLYYMKANSSWGTMDLLSRIQIYFEYSTLNEYQQEIKIYTQVRVENWLLLLSAIIITVLTVQDYKSILPVVIVPPVFVLVIMFSNFIYKMQEQSLIESVRKTIGLRDVYQVNS